MGERLKLIDGLPVCEFGFPGALRDELVAAVLLGEKTATASQSVADWRAAHERFWGPNADREAAGAQPLTIDDDTLVVCERFRLVE